MADIRPFRAYRPRYGLESQIAALPYDVYNREEAKRVVQDNPLSFLAIDRAETQFEDSVSTYDECVYKKARELLDAAIEEGRFVKDAKPCYYLYEQTMNGRTQTGIVACSSIDDYLSGVIKKHENTRVIKEQDRIHHVDSCDAQTGPIFLCYRNSEVIDNVVSKIQAKEPVCDFISAGNIRNRVWVIDTDEDIEVIQTAFLSISETYIADGHHRCASAVKVGLKRREEHPDFKGDEEYNYFLSVLFPQSQLMVMDYNRVVMDLNNLTKSIFLQKIGDNFVVESRGKEQVYPSKRGEFGLYIENEWYLLSLREGIRSADPVKALDVSVLQDLILEGILNISDPKEDPRIDFVGGIRGLDELERRVLQGAAAAFSMYPTSIDELFDVADAGLLMPPKSTWFEPKLLSGLFIHKLS